VKNFIPGDNDYVDRLIAAHGRAYFVVDGDLWKSNGSASGTKMLADNVSDGKPMTNVQGSVYFVAADRLWKTDGTGAGTLPDSTVVPVAADCRPFSPCHFPPAYYSPVGLGGQLFYAADAGGLGVELWQTDGSPDNGAGVLGDLRPGPAGSRPASLTKVGESLYFTANDGTHGRELWRYVP
jgi:ELWxxDGT repeat protein